VKIEMSIDNMFLYEVVINKVILLRSNSKYLVIEYYK